MAAVPKMQYYHLEHWLYTRSCNLFLEAAVLPAPLEHDIAPLWHEIAPIRSVPSNLAKFTRPSSEGLPAIRKTCFLEWERGSGDETRNADSDEDADADIESHSPVTRPLMTRGNKFSWIATNPSSGGILRPFVSGAHLWSWEALIGLDPARDLEFI